MVRTRSGKGIGPLDMDTEVDDTKPTMVASMPTPPFMPPEICLEILQYLNYESLLACRPVSRWWAENSGKRLFESMKIAYNSIDGIDDGIEFIMQRTSYVRSLSVNLVTPFGFRVDPGAARMIKKLFTAIKQCEQLERLHFGPNAPSEEYQLLISQSLQSMNAIPNLKKLTGYMDFGMILPYLNTVPALTTLQFAPVDPSLHTTNVPNNIPILPTLTRLYVNDHFSAKFFKDATVSDLCVQLPVLQLPAFATPITCLSLDYRHIVSPKVWTRMFKPNRWDLIQNLEYLAVLLPDPVPFNFDQLLGPLKPNLSGEIEFECGDVTPKMEGKLLQRLTTILPAVTRLSVYVKRKLDDDFKDFKKYRLVGMEWKLVEQKSVYYDTIPESFIL